MKRVGKVFLLSFVILCVAAPAVWSAGPQSPGQARKQTKAMESVLVGRISFVEGELLRYVPEQKDWVVTVKDSPFGLEDALYAGENGRAEFLMPNSTWIRIGANTQIQMIALKNDATEVDVASGMARFIDRSSKAVVKATTPFGYVIGEPGSAFDLYVGDESAEVIAIRGNVDFIHDADGSRYDVVPGALSILADNRQATAGEGKVDGEWDDWNSTRDTLLVQSIETKGESVNYLPEGIREDSRVLDENGRWEQVYYEGQYRRVWRPTTVEADWAPYTEGRWTEWYGDNTWIPYEPFGYVTHHYGYWFSANNYWYWAPPIVSVGIGAPYWGIGFGWYPGRVGWLYSDLHVGWFPLLPWEPYYASRWWGPWGFRHGGFHHHGGYYAGRFRHGHNAVIVNRNNVFVNNVRSARVTNVNGTGLRGAPVVNNIVRNSGNANQRTRFTDANPTTRPGQNANSRVAQNQSRIRQGSSNINGGNIRQQVSQTRTARAGVGNVAAPRLSSGGTRGSQGAGQSRALNSNPRNVRPSAAMATLSQDRRGSGRTAVQSNRGTTAGRAGQFDRQRNTRSDSGVTRGNRSTSTERTTGQSRRSQTSQSFQRQGRSASGGRIGGQTRRSSDTMRQGQMQRSSRSLSGGRQSMQREQFRGSAGGRQSGFSRSPQGRAQSGFQGGNRMGGGFPQGRSSAGFQGGGGARVPVVAVPEWAEAAGGRRVVEVLRVAEVTEVVIEAAKSNGMDKAG
ncbi:MAG: DUF6600 domain-containing protein [Syntrophobacteraceae bacterium]